MTTLESIYNELMQTKLKYIVVDPNYWFIQNLYIEHIYVSSGRTLFLSEFKKQELKKELLKEFLQLPKNYFENKNYFVVRKKGLLTAIKQNTLFDEPNTLTISDITRNFLHYNKILMQKDIK